MFLQKFHAKWLNTKNSEVVLSSLATTIMCREIHIKVCVIWWECNCRNII